MEAICGTESDGRPIGSSALEFKHDQATLDEGVASCGMEIKQLQRQFESNRRKIDNSCQ